MIAILVIFVYFRKFRYQDEFEDEYEGDYSEDPDFEDDEYE